MLADWRVNVMVAIRSFENWPAPRRFVMTPCGEVAPFDVENPLPSSVPASHGYRSTWSDSTQFPPASSSVSPETPTNQSGLGAIMVTSVTRGWSLVSVTVRAFDVVAPILPVPRTILRAFVPAFVTSLPRADVPPVSAIDSIPAVAASPLLRKVTPALWTAPMRREKCAPLGTPTGVAAAVHCPSNVTV